MNETKIFLDKNNIINISLNKNLSFQIYTNEYNILKENENEILNEIESKYALILSKYMSFNYDVYEYYSIENLNEYILNENISDNLLIYCKYSKYVIKSILKGNNVDIEFVEKYYDLISFILNKFRYKDA